MHCIWPWPEAAWLSDCETLTYLHSCISTRRQRVRVPEAPMYLDAWSTSRWSQGSRRGSPRAHLLTLIVMGFPLVTYPGILTRMKAGAVPLTAIGSRVTANFFRVGRPTGRATSNRLKELVRDRGDLCRQQASHCRSREGDTWRARVHGGLCSVGTIIRL